ncbi:GNAT family N-acetyltransferase [Micromonospora okii]|uniref:GNAT family N-acetyltransferase n=1 Tax=Micromonospora okii TaxID=1182970 RepID=UPI0027960810|nr:GNAT family N-acetyltransferase [Micromonospora okii]
MTEILYTRTDPRLGEFALRALDPAADAALVHSWVTHPKAAFWLMADADVDRVAADYARIAANPHQAAFVGLWRGEPAFLVERYDPAQVELAGRYPARPGDVGMHFLCAPTDTPVSGFSRAVITTVMAWLFADPTHRRVVVEPDARNSAVHALNAAVGFVPAGTVELPDKTGLLSFCTRAQFAAATGGADSDGASAVVDPDDAVGHLTPENWARANRLLVRKALAEFSHERLLTPAPVGGSGEYEVTSDDGTVTYRFAARRLALDHWRIDPDSITRRRDGVELPLDALELCVELRGALGLTDRVLPVYLEEITSTLAGWAYKLDRPEIDAAELARADFQTVETRMTEGHPGFVANNGRIGLGIDEYHRYAPEVARPVRLFWVAGHRDHTTFTCCTDTDVDALYREELGEEVLAGFAATLTGLGLDPADYLYLPVHPWQWWNRLAVTFAADVAERRLVFLGAGPDEYLAQQSLRTFFNVSHPRRHYVKTALAVLNMGFIRGLSAAYMEATPAINDWLADLIDRDEVLKATGLTIIRERAAIGYRNRRFEAATDRYSPYRKMLAALWRESPVPGLEPGRRLATMASLLHVDSAGASFAAALVAESGLAAGEWLRRYLDAYLVPLLHCLYAYDLAFMPHGENVILVLRDGAVERAIFKDIAEEIVVMDPDADLPEAVHRVRANIPEDEKILSIFTDVFSCYLRHLNVVFTDAGLLTEEEFWRTVADCASDYAERVPHLAERLRRHDLFVPEFAHSCLNRLQLRDNQQMVDLSDPSAALQFAGTLVNPIAPYARRS